jgi:NAD+ synthase (glutamine-hydrolysing)
VGPYVLHDFFIYHTLNSGMTPDKLFFIAKKTFEGEFDADTIKKWLKNFYRRFFSQQFKRSCMPDGPKVCAVSLSPRGDWRMPTDAFSRVWMDEVEKL